MLVIAVKLQNLENMHFSSTSETRRSRLTNSWCLLFSNTVLGNPRFHWQWMVHIPYPRPKLPYSRVISRTRCCRVCGRWQMWTRTDGWIWPSSPSPCILSCCMLRWAIRTLRLFILHTLSPIDRCRECVVWRGHAPYRAACEGEQYSEGNGGYL